MFESGMLLIDEQAYFHLQIYYVKRFSRQTHDTYQLEPIILNHELSYRNPSLVINR